VSGWPNKPARHDRSLMFRQWLPRRTWPLPRVGMRWESLYQYAMRKPINSRDVGTLGALVGVKASVVPSVAGSTLTVAERQLHSALFLSIRYCWRWNFRGATKKAAYLELHCVGEASNTIVCQTILGESRRVGRCRHALSSIEFPCDDVLGQLPG
jgi:hypothetical protein